MRCAAILVALALLAAGLEATSLHSKTRTKMVTSPVNKVIAMLNDMLHRAQEAKQAEQVEFSKYSQFCRSTRAEKEHAVEKSKAQIEQLNADIGEATAEINDATQDMADLAEEVGNWEKELEEARKNRRKDKADYEATHKDYTESLNSIEQAKAEVTSGTGATSLLETSSHLRRMPERAMRVMRTFLEKQRRLRMDPSGESVFLQSQVQAPEANAYEGSSTGMIDMIERLDDKFSNERTALEKEEAKARHSHDMIVQQLTHSIDAGTKERQSKSSLRSQSEQRLGEAKGGLGEAKRNLASDASFLGDLNTECQQESEDYENRQSLRAGEITAMEKATEILGGAAVKGASEKHLELVQQEAPSLIQTGSTSHMQARRTQLRTFLQTRAKRLDSNILAMLAQSQNVAEDPFTKVKSMIKDLIVKLMEEANEEAEHKGWCDAELSTNKATRESKTDEAEALKAEIEETTAAVAKLSQEVSETGAEVAANNKALTTATKERTESKHKNKATIKDANQAQNAVAQAVSVLKGFYEGADESAALTQVDAISSSNMMEPFKGQDSSGVLGMLEVIESDFARLESETSANEMDAQREYEKFANDTKEDNAVKETSLRHKASSRQSKQTALSHAKKDLRGVAEELESAADYYEKLKPSCVNAGASYEERVTRRKEEIESLQEGLKILSGDAVA